MHQIAMPPIVTAALMSNKLSGDTKSVLVPSRLSRWLGNVLIDFPLGGCPPVDQL